VLASTGTGNAAVATFAFSLNQWYHIAATRAGATTRLFVNGTSLTLTTNTLQVNSASTGTLSIGSERLFANYNHDLNGYIDDLRITKGVARYTASFTPPVAPHPIPVIDPNFGCLAAAPHERSKREHDLP
jgi:hypothetical protein